MHLGKVLAHLLQRKAEREEPLRGLVTHIARQPFVADRAELLDIGVEIGFDGLPTGPNRLFNHAR